MNGEHFAFDRHECLAVRLVLPSTSPGSAAARGISDGGWIIIRKASFQINGLGYPLPCVLLV